MDVIKELSNYENLSKESIVKEFQKTESIEEKQLLLLLEMRNNIKSIKNMVIFFTVITAIGLLFGLFA